MASEASNIVRLQPRHNRADNIANLHGGRVIPFPEQGMATTTIFDSPKGYMDAWTLLNCQAALVVASAVALYFKAAECSLRHCSNNMEQTTCANPAGKNPEDFREPA
jgi:hypothetical protein